MSLCVNHEFDPNELTPEQIKEALKCAFAGHELINSISGKVKPSDQLEKALHALSKDMHGSSSRPCSTCRDMTNALGWNFGCCARAKATS